eukprot:740500-Prorocentrum_minimum.AAC.2
MFRRCKANNCVAVRTTIRSEEASALTPATRAQAEAEVHSTRRDASGPSDAGGANAAPPAPREAEALVESLPAPPRSVKELERCMWQALQEHRSLTRSEVQVLLRAFRQALLPPAPVPQAQEPEKGTPAGVVNSARGPALGSWEDRVEEPSAGAHTLPRGWLKYSDHDGKKARPTLLGTLLSRLRARHTKRA